MLGIIKYLLITSLLTLLMIGFPSISILTAIGWGSSLILAAVKLNRKQFLAVALFNIALLYVLAGASVLFYYLAFFGLSALIIGLLANSGEQYSFIHKWGITTAVIGVSLFIGVIYLSTGQVGIGELEKQLTIYCEENIQQLEQSGIIAMYEERGISKESLINSMKEMVEVTARHLPAFYYLQAILATFFMLLIVSFLCRKAGLERLIKRPYENEIMPWQFAWIVIAGLAFWLVGREEMNNLYYVGSNILVVIDHISVYYGLSVVVFKIRQVKPEHRPWYTAALVTLSVLLLPSALIFFSVIGVFDSLMDFRKLRMEQEDGK